MTAMSFMWTTEDDVIGDVVRWRGELLDAFEPTEFMSASDDEGLQRSFIHPDRGFSCISSRANVSCPRSKLLEHPQPHQDLGDTTVPIAGAELDGGGGSSRPTRG